MGSSFPNGELNPGSEIVESTTGLPGSPRRVVFLIPIELIEPLGEGQGYTDRDGPGDSIASLPTAGNAFPSRHVNQGHLLA